MKQRPLVAVVLAVLALGCGERQRCELDRNCVAGFVCVGGYCETSCAAGCAAWQTCNPAAVGGTCENVTVRVVAPAADGQEFGGGSSVRVAATVTQWDGGAFRATSIPVVVTGGASGPMVLTEGAPGTYEANYTLANSSGTVTFEAGWAAANATRNLRVSACTVTCADWEQCMPSADGGTCQNLNLTLTWTQPASGQKFGPTGPVALSLQVTGGGGAFTKQVPFSIDSAPAGLMSPLGTGNLWSGSATLGSSNGPRSLVAGWDGGPVSSALVVNVDALPPQLALVVPGDGGAHQRDELLYAVMTADEALADAGLTLEGSPMTQVPSAMCSNFASVAGARACFELDFSVPIFNSFDGGFGATVSGTDGFGNSAGGADGGTFLVTRLRWIRSIDAGIVQALALGSDGVIYAGTTGLPGTGTLARFLPSGALDASVSVGDVQSIAIDARGTDDVFVAFNTSVGNIGGFTPALVANAVGQCTGAAGSKTYSGFALYRPASETFAVGSVNSVAASAGRSCLYGPMSGGASNAVSPISLLDAPLVTASGPTTAANVVVSGSTALFLRQTGAGSEWVPVTLNGGAAPVTGSATTLNAFTVFGQSRMGGSSPANIISTKGAVAGPQVFLRNTSLNSEGNFGVANDKGVSALASETEAYVGMGDALVRFSPANLTTSSLVTQLAVGSDSVRTSPVLGAKRIPASTTGEGYFVSGSGVLAAFTHSGAASSTLWQTAVTQPGENVLTHPTLDCNRRAPASKTGVLYFGTSSGNIYAVVVDSPKLLEATGAWPKYQRTAGNAGNADSAFPVNWPCP